MTKIYIDAMRQGSATFDATMSALENDNSVIVRIGEGSTTRCGGSGGCTSFEGRNPAGQKVFSVNWHEGGIISDIAANGFASDVFTTLGHEVYGHVAPGWGANGFVCTDGPVGTPAAQSCAVRRENVIRRELNQSARPRY